MGFAKTWSQMTEEERAEQTKRMEEERRQREQREAERKQIRRDRRGFPREEERPLCYCGCGQTLRPDFNVISTPEHYRETDVIRGWEGVGNVFRTNLCAMRYAMSRPEVRMARRRNESQIAALNEKRAAEKAKKGDGQ